MNVSYSGTWTGSLLMGIVMSVGFNCLLTGCIWAKHKPKFGVTVLVVGLIVLFFVGFFLSGADKKVITFANRKMY